MNRIELFKLGEQFSESVFLGLINKGITHWRTFGKNIELPLPGLDIQTSSTQLEQNIFVEGDRSKTIPNIGISVSSEGGYMKYWLEFYRGFIEQYGGSILCAEHRSQHGILDRASTNTSLTNLRLPKLYDPLITQAASNAFHVSILSVEHIDFRGRHDPEEAYWQTLGYQRTKERFLYMDKIYNPET